MKKLIIIGLVTITLLLCQKTTDAEAKTISKNTELSKDTVINEDLTVNDVSMNLNGFHLHIKGNLTLKGRSMIDINAGLLEIDGDLNIEDKARIIENSREDRIAVGKNFMTESTYLSEFTYGTLEIKGNFEQKGKGGNNFSANSEHKVILSGTGKQTISFEDADNNGFVVLEIKNKPANVQFPAVMRGWRLESDVVIAEDIDIKGGELLLNGHNLTAEGNVSITDCNVNLFESELLAEGNLTLKGRNMIDINAGLLEIDGDLNIEDKARIIENSRNDRIAVGKNFMTESTYISEFTYGTLEIKGNFEQKGKGGNNFSANSEHKVILSGTGKQTISFEDADNNGFAVLEIKNKPANVQFPAVMRGWRLESDVVIAEDIDIKGGELLLNGHNLTAEGNVSITDCNVNLFESELLAKGNLTLKGRSMIDINAGLLEIDGDLNIEDKARIIENSRNDRIAVGKNFMTESTYISEFTYGTLEIKGNFEQKGKGGNNFSANSEHKVILSGTGKQTISFEDLDNNKFAYLEIVQPKDRIIFLTGYKADNETVRERTEADDWGDDKGTSDNSNNDENGENSDTTLPVVTSTEPTDGSKEVSKDAKTISIIFNENIQQGTGFDSISVVCEGYPPVDISKTISGSKLILTRDNDWTAQCTYRVIVPADAVADLSGNPMAEGYSFTFTVKTVTTDYAVKPASGSVLDYQTFTVSWNKASWAVKYKVTVENMENSEYVFTKELTGTSVKIPVSSLENWHQYKLWVSGIDKNGTKQALGTPVVSISHNYKNGDSGDFINLIQQKLIGKGYDCTINGKFDAGTLKAVNAFKKDNSLLNTEDCKGVVGEDTWNKLNSGIWLQKGDSGELVTSLIKMLVLLDYTAAEEDKGSKFGSGTLKAVNQFKKDNKIYNSGAMEGIVGDEVWLLLADKSGKVNPTEVKAKKAVTYIKYLIDQKKAVLYFSTEINNKQYDVYKVYGAYITASKTGKYGYELSTIPAYKPTETWKAKNNGYYYVDAKNKSLVLEPEMIRKLDIMLNANYEYVVYAQMKKVGNDPFASTLDSMDKMRSIRVSVTYWKNMCNLYSSLIGNTVAAYATGGSSAVKAIAASAVSAVSDVVVDNISPEILIQGLCVSTYDVCEDNIHSLKSLHEKYEKQGCINNLNDALNYLKYSTYMKVYYATSKFDDAVNGYTEDYGGWDFFKDTMGSFAMGVISEEKIITDMSTWQRRASAFFKGLEFGEDIYHAIGILDLECADSYVQTVNAYFTDTYNKLNPNYYVSPTYKLIYN